MATILPIPTTRVSNQFITNRLVRQTQSTQLDIFRLQTQIATGRRVLTPSDDAPAALRAIQLQRVLEAKTQAQTSLGDGASYLNAAESAIQSVSDTLHEVRGAALSVADSVSTPEAREAVAQQVGRAIQQLVDVGNSSFRDRYLFSGSRSLDAPYEYDGNYIAYRGNEETFRSYVDLDFLFDTSVPGTEVFGGLSEEVRSTVDLNPHLTRDTLIRDLNGGQGADTKGSVELIYVDASNVATSSLIDLSGAATIDDVARFLELGAPAGSGIEVEVTGTGLVLSTQTGAEQVLVREVAEGRTARDLGIENTDGLSTITGEDISPAVRKTTQLSDLLGTKSQVTIQPAGTDNDLRITAAQNGASFDGVDVIFADGGTAGSELAVYNAGAGTLTVTIEYGASTAADVLAAINAEGTFTATLDPRDANSSASIGSGTIDPSTDPITLGTTSGGSGEALDQASGLQVTNGGVTETIDISSAETVEDLLNILNRAELGLQAEINAGRDGINIRSRLSGADLTIGEVAGGSTATQLGVRTLTGATRLDGFNRGVGVIVDDNTTLTIEVDNGGVPTTYDVDLSDAITVDDVFTAISQATDPDSDPSTNNSAVTASLAADGNGIVLTDNNFVAGDSLTVSGKPAELLGFFDDDVDSVSSTSGSLTAEDRHTLEVDSLFNSLLRLQTALQNNDIPGIGQEINRIDEDVERISAARTEIGARVENLETLRIRHEDEEVTLKSTLSEEIDVDITEAITEFTNRQFALQASLQATGNILRLSLLDFL